MTQEPKGSPPSLEQALSALQASVDNVQREIQELRVVLKQASDLLRQQQEDADDRHFAETTRRNADRARQHLGGRLEISPLPYGPYGRTDPLSQD